jgi:hypothetical protein
MDMLPSGPIFLILQVCVGDGDCELKSIDGSTIPIIRRFGLKAQAPQASLGQRFFNKVACIRQQMTSGNSTRISADDQKKASAP